MNGYKNDITATEILNRRPELRSNCLPQALFNIIEDLKRELEEECKIVTISEYLERNY